MKVYVVYTVEILNMCDEVISDIDRVTATPPENALCDTRQVAIRKLLSRDGSATVYREMEVLA